ncbi:MAG: aminoacetone oxidase family FAD-binding enzyme [Candidatus Moraniibacteriota bacterium]
MNYDVIVIGGGPAGMMAAGRAAECGARVALLEKNTSLGVKLLITGGGRSNVTNAQFDEHIFLHKFGVAGKFLYSPLSQFGVQSALDFFHAHGMPTKIEAEKRVFPVSDSAQSVWDALVGYMRQGNVAILTGMEVSGLEMNDGVVTGVRMKNGSVLRARSYVLATGGQSRPETGSTGDGFRFLKHVGHTVVESRPSLVPLRVREPWVAKLSGVSFPEAKLTYFQKDRKIESRKGKILFTHVGLSGPLVLNMSRNISEFLEYGHVPVSLDLIPDKNIGEIDHDIQVLFENQKNKQVKNSLDGLLQPVMIPVLLELADINPETPVHSISRDERMKLARLVKDFRLTVTGLLGADKAIVTSGGVPLEEVDCKYMRSRKFHNLYLVGDVLNIDRPSGGYSLQLCWTTGYVAGTSATS